MSRHHQAARLHAAGRRALLGLLVALGVALTPAGATAVPSDEPSQEPTEESTPEPTTEPTADPTTEPTTEPTAEPTTEPTTEPTAEPTEQPEPDPAPDPTVPPEQPTPPPTVVVAATGVCDAGLPAVGVAVDFVDDGALLNVVTVTVESSGSVLASSTLLADGQQTVEWPDSGATDVRVLADGELVAEVAQPTDCSEVLGEEVVNPTPEPTDDTSGDPDPTQPTDPVTTNPDTTNPDTTNPDTSGPDTSGDPDPTQPTDPDTTDPDTTDPSVPAPTSQHAPGESDGAATGAGTPRELAATGSATGPGLLVGSLLVALGLLALGAGRRRSAVT